MKIALCYYGLIRKLDFLEDLVEHETFDYFISAGIDKIKISNSDSKFKKSNFEDDTTIKVKPLVHNLRVAKACYHINKVVRLKEEYEISNNFSYDAVVLLRTDYNYNKETLLKNSIKVKEVSDNIGLKPVCLIKEQLIVTKDMMYLNQDDLFIHNNEGANLHANLYNSLYLQKNSDKINAIFDNYHDNGHTVQAFLLSNYPFFIIN